MLISVSGKLSVANSNGISQEFHPSLEDFEENEASEENLGVHTCYSATFSCDDGLEYLVEVWEYPEGYLSESAITPKNGVVDNTLLFKFGLKEYN